MSEANRDLSNWIGDNIHIDELNKAIIAVRVRGKEDFIAALQTANADLLEALENLSGAVHAVGYDTTSIVHPALLNANEAIRKHKGEVK